MINKRNLTQHELIGFEVEVVEASHRGYVGLKGKVIDETKNMLVIESNEKEKKIPKLNTVFKFKISQEEKEVTVRGSNLLFRPEDRIKKAKPLR